MRAVGFCSHTACEDFLKSTFLLNHGDTFYCPRCRVLGFVEKERKVDWSAKEDPSTVVYKTVRVHFNYSAASKTYQEIAIVEIAELNPVNAGLYELYSPMIMTENLALKVAEATLCLINSGLKEGLSNELVVDWDRDNWRDQLIKLESLLNERERRVAHALAR